MEEKRPLQSVPDHELLHRLTELMGRSRGVEADVVAHIAEIDERRLYAREAFPSMFAYCTNVLHLSEAETYLRIAVARASLEHPILLTMLADGRLHLTGIERLAPHLTPENRDRLLERATHQSKRRIEELIAEIAPRPDVPVVVRKVPPTELPNVPGSADAPSVELRPDGVAAPVAPVPIGPGPVPRVSPTIVQPLSPGRYKVQFTASAELYDKLVRLRALTGSREPNRDLAAIIEQAVTEKLERLEVKRFASTKASRKVLARIDPSRSGRHIPAAIRRAVSERDGRQCRYVNDQGRRCPERVRLEFHHGHPFGFGGDHGVDNIRMMCRAHNAYLAEVDYGRKAMALHRRPGPGASEESAGKKPSGDG